MSTTTKQYTVGEEIANAITHGVGAALSITGLTLLVVFSSLGGDPWRIVSASIFGAALTLMYFASTLYHALPFPRAKRVMRVLDHSSIYLLIAGTYTPFLLVSMRGPWGWSLFFVVWGIAVVGCVFKIFFTGRFDIVSTLAYIVMGWTVIVAIKPALATIPVPALVLTAVGGLLYTGGTIFYAWTKLRYHHAVWHVFVLSASIVQYLAILPYIVPVRG
jgi:hemolysin III